MVIILRLNLFYHISFIQIRLLDYLEIYIIMHLIPKLTKLNKSQEDISAIQDHLSQLP